tara:strand:- start:92 stop:217 length:126 start_codon:yes stop_codon:yes gene_type:complete
MDKKMKKSGQIQTKNNKKSKKEVQKQFLFSFRALFFKKISR